MNYFFRRAIMSAIYAQSFGEARAKARAQRLQAAAHQARLAAMTPYEHAEYVRRDHRLAIGAMITMGVLLALGIWAVTAFFGWVKAGGPLPQ